MALYEVTVDDAITYYKRETEAIEAYMEAHKHDIPYGLNISLQCYQRGLMALKQYKALHEKAMPWKKISPAGIYECPVCGQNVMTSDISCYKFCHGCGIRMEVENEQVI